MSETTLLEFPCDFPIKIMGRESAEFRALARALVEKHTGPLADSSLQFALSRSASFVSVTITVKAAEPATARCHLSRRLIAR